jgi:hypothetical protein
VDLLTPTVPGDPLPDGLGEDPAVDLQDAEVWLDGSVLSGTIDAPGIAQTGAWVDLDLGDGPAPDLEIGVGNGWARILPLDKGDVPPTEGGVLPVLDGDRLSFQVDLAGRAPEGVSGWARARVATLDGRVVDMGPAGLFGPPPDEAVDVLLALVQAGPITDADLAVSLAVTFGALRPLVADDVTRRVDTDAVGWLRYGEGLDAWLADKGALWRLGTLDPLAKLTWAWPAAQSVVYGAVPLAGVRGPLDADHYRFVVPDVATLTALRDRAPFAPAAANTARGVDKRINAQLRYRTHTALMETLCRTGKMTPAVCKGWHADARTGADLGLLGDTPVSLWEGVSATWQLGVFARQGAWVGDCATATALTITTLQALGIPAIGVGWSGEDLGTPTHDMPLFYDGELFRGTQPGPTPEWWDARAFVYVTLPGVHPLNAFTLGQEPGGWSRGGSVAGGWTTYGELERALREGLTDEALGSWVDVEAAGGWPTW